MQIVSESVRLILEMSVVHYISFVAQLMSGQEPMCPVAKVGTYLPIIDVKIRASKLRGVRSEGMICSLKELGLEKESAGIYIFDEENLQLGSDVRPLLGLTDVILDLTATANRADALSMVGIAREVAALTGASLQLPEISEKSIASESGSLRLKNYWNLKLALPTLVR